MERELDPSVDEVRMHNAVNIVKAGTRIFREPQKIISNCVNRKRLKSLSLNTDVQP